MWKVPNPLRTVAPPSAPLGPPSTQPFAGGFPFEQWVFRRFNTMMMITE
jgi:hypothetical protein